ncbi:MAG: Mut7-C RNAse domain-containing protein [Pseudomonadota bacterium]|uniref:Mut7-C RNAse domain-containing protein n=1 Tax=Ralstonia pickettii TaxID=329 RepID=UPI002715524B|nr:Mut7-C RNAse domain-containing protein [Ralstonia pickettii]MEE2978668.1 Mut7-C RNAse domain-containing protein [Pseudomonadota bacterium]WKZ88233.1 Mut7-C ubiquitin/RNAse domain-containing protein [Ralstonia pickettii]
MQTVVLTFDSGLTPLLPQALRGHPVARAWAEGATLKHAIEALGVPHTEIGQVLVDGRPMALEALLPARGHVAVSSVEPFSPAAPLHFLCDAHLGATARLLRMAGFDTAYDNNYADAAIEALAHEEDWIVLSRDRELLKRRGIRRGAFIRAREPQAQMREIVTRLRLAAVAKPFSRCLECNVPLRMLSQEEASASVPPRVRERQRLFSTCDVCRRIYWPGSHWARMNAVLADMLWPEAGASADSAETAERMPRTGSAGA